MRKNPDKKKNFSKETVLAVSMATVRVAQKTACACASVSVIVSMRVCVCVHFWMLHPRWACLCIGLTLFSVLACLGGRRPA